MDETEPIVVVVASANPGKARELEAALTAALGRAVDVRARPDDLADVEETGETFEANARLKAIAVSDHTGHIAVADDSGLLVDALDGAPGVRSARFAGESATDADNVALLLDRLADVAAPHRTASFHCALVARFPDGREFVASGDVTGTIATEPSGDGGFGYDPVFVANSAESSAADGRTFAQMSSEEKASMSHRSRAVAALVSTWRETIET